MLSPKPSPDPNSEGAAPADAQMLAARPKRGGWSLSLRIGSAVLFVPLLLLLAKVGGIAFLGFVAVQAADRKSVV